MEKETRNRLAEAFWAGCGAAANKLTKDCKAGIILDRTIEYAFIGMIAFSLLQPLWIFFSQNSNEALSDGVARQGMVTEQQDNCAPMVSSEVVLPSEDKPGTDQVSSASGPREGKGLEWILCGAASGASLGALLSFLFSVPTGFRAARDALSAHNPEQTS
ncbi:MAG: hypothetical protein JKP92_04245 [Alphaproteobacteria bacterium]|nr:hypothetical protein [Alphaproteobacteria bacterium]